ncbi:MAG: MerR family transcriptional regulator [Anaerolineaceae bacterium]
MKIADVGEQFVISADTLRYYERVGLISPVNRTVSGIRDYNGADLKQVEFIKCMRKTGFPSEVLIDYFGLFQQCEIKKEARRDNLKEHCEQLSTKIKEMQITLDLLDYKIWDYEDTVAKKEKEMVIIEI